MDRALFQWKSYVYEHFWEIFMLQVFFMNHITNLHLILLCIYMCICVYIRIYSYLHFEKELHYFYQLSTFGTRINDTFHIGIYRHLTGEERNVDKECYSCWHIWKEGKRHRKMKFAFISASQSFRISSAFTTMK